MLKTYSKTNELVQIIHYGYNSVLIQHKDGKQEIVNPEDVGLEKRVKEPSVN